jgi:hypothetical protein
MPWLLRAQPYDEALPGIRTLYFSDVGFTTEPADSPANTYWQRRIQVPLTARLALFAGTATGGRSDVSFGAVVLANDDGALDGLADYDWDGRLVEVLYTPNPRPVLADFAVVFSGAAERLLPGDDLEIEVRDLQVLLDEPLQPARFAGTGGAEGPAEFKDRRKPTLFGVRRQFTPLLLDAANLVWCYHSGPVGGPLAVRDAGVALPVAANYATYAALIAAAIPAGQYATCNALGLLRLNAPPAGALTIDAEGAKPGASVLVTFADITQHAITRATSLTTGDFATGTVAALNAIAGQTLGHWDDGGNDTTLREVLDTLADSIGAFYGFDDARKIVLGRLDAPAVTPDAILTARDIDALRPLPAERRLKTMTVGWGQRVNPLRDEDIAGSVTGTARTALIEPWRQERHTDAAVATASLLAREERLDSAMDTSAAALAEAQRRVALYGPRRRAFDVEAVLVPGLRPGMTVEIRDARFGLAAGARFRLLRIERDAAREGMVLEVWG